ncbi:hypothetical protein BH11PSE4_BH11PSE4_44160 [soil metagenome]
MRGEARPRIYRILTFPGYHSLMREMGTEAATISGRRKSPLEPLAVVLGAMTIGAAYAFVMGEDANWDLRNYHIYNVWATLTHRYALDAAPAGFQTYINPLPYFPFYYLNQWLSPLAAGLIMGAVQGLNLAMVYSLTRILLGAAASRACLIAAVLLAAFGPITLSEVGTSFADITLSLPIMAALALILFSDAPKPTHYLLAGLLMGVAVGLKLTNVVLALGLTAAAIASARPAMAMYCVIAGGSVGGLIGGGWWSLMLLREFGNPVFPLFSGFFPSPDSLPINILDRQFIPRGVIDGLGYPFYWLIGDNRSSEYAFRDGRFALAVVLLVAAIGAGPLRRSAPFTRRDIQFLIFFAVSYAAWMTLFSIQRYIVVLELLCGPLIVLLMVRLLSGTSADHAPRGLGRRGAAVILAVSVLTAAWTQPGDWLRRAWSDPYKPALPTPLAQPATYLLLDKPLGYIAPLLPAASRFYQLADIALPIAPGGKLDRRIRAGLADPLPGGIRELHLRGTVIRPELLEHYGLAIDASQSCQTIDGLDPGAVIEVCPVIKRER